MLGIIIMGLRKHGQQSLVMTNAPGPANVLLTTGLVRANFFFSLQLKIHLETLPYSRSCVQVLLKL